MNGDQDRLAVWRGRVDDDEEGDTRRWHQVMAPFDERSRGGTALIGFAVDEGVRRNGGRCGAAGGPAALRAALANMPLLGEGSLYDAGDVVAADADPEAGSAADLEGAQSALAAKVALALRQGVRPLVLGGGHELAWGTFQGLSERVASSDSLLVVNVDAHFDLRCAARPNSGTPFFQIGQWCRDRGRRFDYRAYGISRYANTRALFDRARSWGVEHCVDEALQRPDDVDRAIAGLEGELRRFDAVYLTVCLDALPAAVAPGVSAPAPLGVPLAHVEQLIGAVMASGKLLAADVAELNPLHDADGRTARVAARLAARLAGHEQDRS